MNTAHIIAAVAAATIAGHALAESDRIAPPTKSLSPIISTSIAQLKTGTRQTYKNMTVIPLFSSLGEGPDYITLKEAINAGSLEITEVSEGGSVPELRARNNDSRAVLMLDGEQLVGAKQNRILNTTILLGPKSDVVIPVSCTEHGRWTSTSKSFGDAGNLMLNSMRAENAGAVADSLASGQKHRSDQGRIWRSVGEVQKSARVESKTAALQDVYTAKESDLDTALKSFPCQPRQKGMIVLINGSIVGMDCVSREAAYAVLHEKLIRSYAMDALLRTSSATCTEESADAFLRSLLSCSERQFPSVALGTDYRFSGPGLVGSALVHIETVVHMAFFKTALAPVPTPRPIEPMAPLHQRRDNRIER